MKHSQISCGPQPKWAMITIDGSILEGGGQILRTASCLSALGCRHLRVHSIRAGRPRPGLMPQHFQGLRAVAEVAGSVTLNAEAAIGSTEIEYIPHVRSNSTQASASASSSTAIGTSSGGVDEYVIDTRTAGSITLLIQSLLPVVALSRFRARSVRLVLRGGTTVSHSPAIDYWTHVASPVLQRRLGLRLSTSIVRRGYYPKGGGEVRLEVEPSELRPFQMMECGKPVRAAVYISGAITPSSSAHTLLRDLSELIPPALNCAFGNTCSCTLDASQVTFDRMGGAYGGRGIRSRGGPSAVIHALLVVETDTGCIYGADRLIEGQSMQETDAREVTAALVGSIEAYLRSGATCDEHMADQLVVWMALLSGCSAVSTGRRLCTALVPPRALMTSQHLETAVLIARQVLGDIMQSPSGGDGAGSTGSLGGIDLTLSEPTPSGPMLLSCSC